MSSRLIPLVLVMPLFFACAKKTPAIEEPRLGAQAAAAQKPAPVPETKAEAVARVVENLARVHFPFNSEMMTEDSRDALSENARILIAHPSIVVEVQGHCDERGTTEYNLALGQRRFTADHVHAVLGCLEIDRPNEIAKSAFGCAGVSRRAQG
jgi:peptidoglycan-associated lipoprotein